MNGLSPESIALSRWLLASIVQLLAFYSCHNKPSFPSSSRFRTFSCLPVSDYHLRVGSQGVPILPVPLQGTYDSGEQTDGISGVPQRTVSHTRSDWQLAPPPLAKFSLVQYQTILCWNLCLQQNRFS